jgi:hypothetical protein
VRLNGAIDHTSDAVSIVCHITMALEVSIGDAIVTLYSIFGKGNVGAERQNQAQGWQ